MHTYRLKERGAFLDLIPKISTTMVVVNTKQQQQKDTGNVICCSTIEEEGTVDVCAKMQSA